MASAREVARRVGAAHVVVAVATPLVLTAVVVAAGRLDAARAIAAWSVRTWAVALALALVCSIVNAARARDVAAVLAAAALLSVVAQPFVWSACRVEGVADVGEHEEEPAWRTLSRGALASVPVVGVDDVDAAADAVSLSIDGDLRRVALGRRVDLGGGLFVEVQGPYPAPQFVVRRRGGEIEAEGLVKLDPGAREYLEPGILPHRLYISVPATESALAPASLHLRVQRGKIRVLERDVAADEDVEFEAVVFRYSGGALWVRAKLRKEPRLWLLGLGGALGLAAAGLWVRRKGGAR